MPVSDPVLIFAIIAVLILISPVIMGRFRLPGMIGLLLAGAILGPNASGVLARDESFVLLGNVGLIYIMFTAALEIDLVVFKRYRYHSLVFGLFTFLFPQVLGTLAAYYLLDFTWPAAILLASLFASHTLVAYPIASRLGLAKNLAVVTAIGGTILTDTLALLVLAVIAGTYKGEVSTTFWLTLGLTMSIYVGAILIGLPMLGRWFFRRVSQDGVSEFVFVLAAVFGVASLAHAAGSEPIIGAFLAGLALNRLIPHNGTLMNRINFTGDAIFVPFFLISVGMLLDVEVFTAGIRSWLVAGLMVFGVIVTKWLAATSTRFVFGFKADEGRVIFGLSVAQAAATLAAVMVGYELIDAEGVRLFDDAVVNGAIVMIIVTCTLAPLAVDRAGRRLAAAKQDDGDLTGPPERILVVLDQQATAPALLELGVLVRDHDSSEPLYPLAVVEEGDGAIHHVAQAEQLLSQAVVELSAAEVPASPVTRIDFNLAAAVLRARRELRVTEVVVGWGGKTRAPELLFGTLTEQLLSDRDYTLVLSRLVESATHTKRVLLAVPPDADLEHGFAQGVRVVKRLAQQVGARILVVTGEAQEERVLGRVRAVKPEVELKAHGVQSFHDLVRVVTDIKNPGDTLVLVGTRSVNPALPSSLGSLPAKLAKRFPLINMLLLYPGTPPADAPMAASPTRREARPVQLSAGNTLPQVPGATIDVIIRKLLGRLMPDDRRPRASLVTRLVQSARILTDGVVLVHCEWATAPGHVIGVATSVEGVRVPGTDTRAHVIVLALDPPARDHTRHVKTVARLAQALSSPEAVARARDATDPEVLAAALSPQAAPLEAPALSSAADPVAAEPTT